jgi:hypothetical protein
MKKVSLVLILFSTVLFSCSKTEHGGNPVKPTEFDLVFGDFYGMCAGDCFDVYGLNRTSLHEDITAERYMGQYSFKPTHLREREMLDSVRHLLLEIPNELLTTNKSVFGSPDSHDQGGIYLEFNHGRHNSKSLTLDHDDTPDQSTEVKRFKLKLREALNKLR